MSTRAAAGPWLVPVTSLRRTYGAKQEERRAGPVGELLVAGSVIPAEARVEADVVLESVDGGIEVYGRVTAPWQGECRRCLQPVSGELTSPVRELYMSGQHADRDDAEDTYPLQGDQLDLEPLVRDALLLDLPLAPLCRPDCQGLCPSCGADLNRAACSCAPRSTVDPRWQVLDALSDPGSR